MKTEVAPSEHKLIAQARRGNHEAFTALVQKHSGKIYGVSLRMLKNREDAEDNVQNVLVKAYYNIGRFAGQSQFSTWLFRIAQNSAIDALRKKTISEVSLTRQSTEDEPGTKEREFADDGISPYRALKNKQLSAAIDKAVEHLPVDYRELIQLRHFAELSYEEIASMKKLPLGTVKNKLFRARNLLKEALDSFVEPL